jgi:hypothetical protein
VGVGKIYRKEWWQDAPVQDVTLFWEEMSQRW